MKLTIKQTPDAILLAFSNEKLTISKDSDEWNNEFINHFLLKLAAQMPTNEKIEIDPIPLEEKIWKHKNFLTTYMNYFMHFATEYNK